MHTIDSEDWNNVHSFKEIYFGLNITVNWPQRCNTAVSTKKCPHNNSPMRGLTTLVYICLMQHFSKLQLVFHDGLHAPIADTKLLTNFNHSKPTIAFN